MPTTVKTARHFALLACTILLVGAIASDADARQKKKGVQGGTCSCECRSDEKNLSGLPKYTAQISFDEFSEYTCHKNSGFGGCRIAKPGGGYAAGTMRLCSFKEAGAASLDNGGVDPSGGAPPLQPFQRPGSIFSP